MAKQSVLNIASLFATQTELELKDFSGNPTGIKLKVVGTDSKEYKAAERKMFPYAGKSVKELSEEEVVALSDIKRDMTLSFIVGWDNDETFGGAYTPEFAASLFSGPDASYILEQVEEFARTRANFFRTGKK